MSHGTDSVRAAPGRPLTPSLEGEMKPAPAPDDVSAFYWEGAARGVLVVAACVPAGHLNFPPDVACSVCGSRELEPHEVSGRGSVYSFTVVRQAFDTAFA